METLPNEIVQLIINQTELTDKLTLLFVNKQFNCLVRRKLEKTTYTLGDNFMTATEWHDKISGIKRFIIYNRQQIKIDETWYNSKSEKFIPHTPTV